MMHRRNRAIFITAIAACLVVLGLAAHAADGPTTGGDVREGEKRMSEKETAIKLIVGGTVIPAVLNDSTPSRALLAKLPFSVKLQRYEHDYCGVMSETLPYDAAELRSGWKNGDIAYAVNGNYFAILYKDEEISQQFDGMVTMGRLDCPPSVMSGLDAGILLRIESE